MSTWKAKHDNLKKLCLHLQSCTKSEDLYKYLTLLLPHRTEGVLDKNCHEELMEFVEVVDPINDYQLNYALMQNCGDYISEHCKIEQGKE